MTITIKQLENYTEKNPQEVLIVKAKEEEKVIEIIIFKGFSSSLTAATAFDPDLPILSEQGEIIAIDRLVSPYNPKNPHHKTHFLLSIYSVLIPNDHQRHQF